MLSLDDKQRRELWGLGLFALALLLALSLVPLAAFGEGATRIFASQNIVGVAGSALSGALTGFMGVAAVALPVLAALWGAFAFGKLDAGTALRWSILLAGLIVLVPSAISVLGGTAGEPTPAAGWLGAAVAVLLVSALSAVGGAVVIFFLFAALCVATVGWNPLRTAFHGGRFAFAHARQAAVSLPRPAIALPSPLKLLPRRAVPGEPLPVTPEDDGIEDAEFEFEDEGYWAEPEAQAPAVDPDATQLDPFLPPPPPA